MATIVEPAHALTDCFGCVFSTHSGADAIEETIILAQHYGEFHKAGVYEIITLNGSFHGRTPAVWLASGKAAFDALFELKLPGFTKAESNDIASVERLVGNNTIVVRLEAIQGESGVWLATIEFWQSLGQLTARTLMPALNVSIEKRDECAETFDRVFLGIAWAFP